MPVATTLVLGSTPASGRTAARVNVSATLTRTAHALSGKTVVFRVGTSIATGVTNGSGVATATLSLQTNPGPQQITATFDGEPDQGLEHRPGAVHGRWRPATNLTLTVGTGGLPGDARAACRRPSRPARRRSRAGSSPSSRPAAARPPGKGFIKSVTTDAAGVAALGSIAERARSGSYSLKAYFSGTIPLHPWAPPRREHHARRSGLRAERVDGRGLQGHWPFTGFFSPVDNLPTVNVAKAGSTIPVKFSLGGNRGLGILAATRSP